MNTLNRVAISFADFLRATNPSANLSSTNSAEQDKAMALLQKWLTKYRQSPTSIKNFYNINFYDFVSRLSDLIVEPFLLNQGSYGLCTMSSLLFVILKEKPEAIVSYAMQLYSTGKGMLGSLEVKPDTTFNSQNFEQIVLMNDVNTDNNQTYFIGPDLLMMGALRDSENIIPFDFDNRGLTLMAVNRLAVGGVDDDIVGILNRTKLFKTVVSITANSKLTFKDFDTEIRKHRHVILFFHSTGDIEKVMNNDRLSVGKHHCALQYNYIRPIDKDANSYNFVFVTWGRIKLQKVTQKDFNDALISYVLVD
jgi:hypothetical protein